MSKKIVMFLLMAVLCMAACSEESTDAGKNQPEPTKAATATPEVAITPEPTKAPEVTVSTTPTEALPTKAVAELSEGQVYTVTLMEPGEQMVKAITIYRNWTGAGLFEAKEAVESAPCTVIETKDKAEAENVVADFNEIGAVAEINIVTIEKDDVPEFIEGYEVYLIEAGANKIKVIELYQMLTGCSLLEAKKSVESTPCIVVETKDKKDAEDYVKAFTEVGATAKLLMPGEEESSLPEPTAVPTVTVTPKPTATPEPTATPAPTPAPVPARVKSAKELAFEERFATYTSRDQMTDDDEKMLAQILLTCWKELDFETLKLYDADATNHTNIEKVASVMEQDPEIAEVWKEIMSTLNYDEETGRVFYKDLEYMAYQYYTECYLQGVDCPYNNVDEMPKKFTQEKLKLYFEAVPYRYLNNGLNISYKTINGKLKIELDEFLAKTYYVNLKNLCRGTVANGEEAIYWGRLVFGTNVDYAENYSRMESGYPELKTILSGSMEERVAAYEANVNTDSADYRLYQKVASYYKDAAVCKQIDTYFEENCAVLLAGKTMRLYTPMSESDKNKNAGVGGKGNELRWCYSISSFDSVKAIFEVVNNMKDAGLLK